MGIIQVLDEALASQIAAGEVVERPSSVVKELLENAMDAEASQIDVHYEGGGVDRLIVQDNGLGMTSDDARLCFSRHATSKLHTIDDLTRIETFGFRGEALGAIGSVSKIKLVTRPPNSDSATELRIEGGSIVHEGETGAPYGTRIEVKDLFYNVPARRKFLKQERTEAGHIDKLIKSVALGNPNIAFQVRGAGKKQWDLAGSPIEAPITNTRRIERVVSCLGKQVRDYIYPFEGTTEYLTVSGYLVAPLETKRDLGGIHLHVNGRWVRDRGLLQAIRVAYRTLLEVGRQPICAIQVKIAPEEVDVNVHPQKTEIRFADPRKVHSHIIRLLSDFLSTTPWLKQSPSRSYSLHRHEDSLLRFQDAGHENLEHAPPDPTDLSQVHRSRVKEAFAKFQKRSSMNAGTQRGDASQDSDKAGWKSGGVAPALNGLAGFGSADTFSALRVVGQVGQLYLVLDGPDGMVVIDQHAAHERVVFENLRVQVKKNATASQPLLFPLQINLDSTEMSTLEEHGKTLLNYGIDIEPFGSQSAMIRSIPGSLNAGKVEQIARDALAELLQAEPTTSLHDMVDQVCARLACHSAIRKGQKLTHDEIRALLRDLDRIDLGAHCPHGRPVVRHLPWNDMAKWFDRH
jgi:DNA mismatch repair protein MutL